MLEALLAYLAIFAAAAIPWVEIIVVIPPAILLGMNPVAVTVVACAGNALPVVGIVLAERQINALWQRWRRQLDEAVREATGRSFSILSGETEVDTASEAAEHGEEEPRKQGWRRAFTQRVIRRYGVPGLALIAPITTGIHMATLMALALRATRGFVVAWMVASLVLWSVVVTVLTLLGVSLFW